MELCDRCSELADAEEFFDGELLCGNCSEKRHEAMRLEREEEVERADLTGIYSGFLHTSRQAAKAFNDNINAEIEEMCGEA